VGNKKEWIGKQQGGPFLFLSLHSLGEVSYLLFNNKTIRHVFDAIKLHVHVSTKRKK